MLVKPVSLVHFLWITFLLQVNHARIGLGIRLLRQRRIHTTIRESESTLNRLTHAMCFGLLLWFLWFLHALTLHFFWLNKERIIFCFIKLTETNQIESKPFLTLMEMFLCSYLSNGREWSWRHTSWSEVSVRKPTIWGKRLANWGHDLLSRRSELFNRVDVLFKQGKNSLKEKSFKWGNNLSLSWIWCKLDLLWLHLH